MSTYADEGLASKLGTELPQYSMFVASNVGERAVQHPDPLYSQVGTPAYRVDDMFFVYPWKDEFLRIGYRPEVYVSESKCELAVGALTSTRATSGTGAEATDTVLSRDQFEEYRKKTASVFFDGVATITGTIMSAVRGGDSTKQLLMTATDVEDVLTISVYVERVNITKK